MKNRKKTNHNLILAIVFFLLLAIVSYSVILNFSANEHEDTKKMEKEITPSTPPPVIIRFEGAAGKRVFTPNEQITVQAIANSQGRSIGGYDIVFQYDSQKLRFVSANGTLADFQSFSSTEGTTISFTAAKKLQPSLSAYFNDTVIAEFVFTPVATGTAQIVPQFKRGNTKDTNLVSEDAKDILTSVTPTTITIGNSLTLEKGKEAQIGDNKMSVILEDVIPHQVGCADCVEYAKITVKQDGAKETLEFKSGGIAGIVDTYKEALGYGFEVSDLATDTLKVTFSKLQ